MPAQTRLRNPALMLGCIVLLGAVLRFAIYIQNSSLWFDEILVALNVATRPWFSTAPLSFEQTAPPLYLVLVRASASLLGLGEMSLRLPSLIAGILVLFFVAALGWRMGGAVPAALSAMFAALSANLCRYSSELKPYEWDAAVCAGLLLLAQCILTGQDSRARRILLAAAGAIACFFSTPSVFVLCGIAVVLWWTELEKPDHRSFLSPALILIVWIAAFATAYTVFYAPVAANEYMRQFWAAGTMSLRHPRALVRAFVEGLFLPVLGADDISVLDNTSILIGLEGAVLAVLGIREAFRRQGARVTALFLIPPAAAAGAALFGKWFLVVRLMLFFAPAMCVLIGMGLWQVARRRSRYEVGSWAGWLIVGLAAVVPAKSVVGKLAHPEIQANREVVQACLDEVQTGDVVYVFPVSTAAWLYYSSDLNDPRELGSVMAFLTRAGPNSGNSPSRGRAVTGEGDDWRREKDGRIELYGVPTGIQSALYGPSGPADPGWAENEVRRMMTERPGKSLWIFVSQRGQAQAVNSLQEALREHGVSRVQTFRNGNVNLYRIFPRPTSK